MMTSTASLALLLALAQVGQPATAPEVRPADTGTVVVADPVQQAREMIEDVEVLRAILSREIQVLYGANRNEAAAGDMAGLGLYVDPSSSMAPMGGGMGGGMDMMGGMMPAMGGSGYGDGYGSMMGSAAPRSAENARLRPLGAYVEGLGIVYQLELPAFREPPPAEEQTDVSQCTWLSRTDWERTRATMRGELTIADCQKCHDTAGAGGRTTLRQFLNRFSTGQRPMSRSATGSPTREQLVDGLVALLAEYGQHVRHLQPDERIAIAVTVRPRPPQTASGMGDMGPSGMPGGLGSEGGDSGSMGPAGGAGGYGEGREYGADYGAASGGYGSEYGGGYAGDASGYEAGQGPGADSGEGATPPGTGSLPGGAGYNPYVSSGRALLGISGLGYPGGGSPMGPGGSTGSPGAGRGGSGLTGEAGSDELSGDLYLRQGRVADAASAYERALLNAYGMAETGPNAAVPPHAVLSDLFGQGWRPPDQNLIQKLLQAYAAAGNFDKARILLEKWKDETPGRNAKRSATAGRGPAVPLPARLVISASKNQLDAVAAGKLSRDQFQQHALVRWFDPQAPDERVSTRGVVIEVANDVVEISLGTEDGLRVRTPVAISRGHMAIAEAEIVRVGPDRSTARITSRFDTEDGSSINPGDRVSLPSE